MVVVGLLVLGSNVCRSADEFVAVMSNVSPPEGHTYNLVDPASSHMLVSKIKPCMSQYKSLYGKTANGSLQQL